MFSIGLSPTITTAKPISIPFSLSVSASLRTCSFTFAETALPSIHKIKMDGEYVFYKDTEESKRLIAETEEKYRAYEDEKAAKKNAKAAKKIENIIRR